MATLHCSCVPFKRIVLNTEKNIVIDKEGNKYKTVQIGDQIWMAENLRSTKYSNGTTILNVTDKNLWALLLNANNDKGYCYYNNNLNGEKDIYGALYTFAAAVNGTPSAYNIDVQGVCPDGWHIPSHTEWKQLEIFLGMSKAMIDTTAWRGTIEAKKIKATFGWKNEGNGTDDFGFCALPGGIRGANEGEFESITRYGYWWSSTDGLDGRAWARYMFYKYDEIGAYPIYKSVGASVRCVKNKED